MRVIKFRAWNGTTMDYDYRDAALWNGLLVAEGDTILMQWTGLTDRQGKEVYEGDIVKAIQTGYPNAGRVAIEIVEYSPPYLLQPFARLVGYDGEIWLDELVDGFEVIGNIYETPELVKE